MEKDTGRIEAFSDGVFAVAITLLVLEIKIPHGLAPDASLVAELEKLWPSFLGFVISFLTILIMWVNHHRLFRLVKRTDEWLLIANGLLLLVVTFIPFPTAVLAENIQSPQARTAAIFYCGVFVVLALFYNLLWWSMAHNHRLVDPKTDGHWIRGITRQYMGGPLMYLFAMGLAYFSVPACLAANFLFAIFFAFPGGMRSKPPLMDSK